MRGERPSELTPRERDVLHLVRVGLTNEEIAARLGISPDTAKFHVSQILAKLGVSSREEAAELASSPGGLTQRLRGVAIAAKAALIGSALIVLAALAFLAWSLIEQDSDETESSAAASSKQLLYAVGGAEIVVIDAISQEVVHTMPSGYDPLIAISPDGGTLYLTARQPEDDDYTLSVIDTSDWTVRAKVPADGRIPLIGVGEWGMHISADGRYVYIEKREIEEGRFDQPNGTNVPNSDYWWETYDTTRGEFVPNQLHNQNCGGALLPLPDRSSPLPVLCFGKSTLDFLDPISGDIIGTVELFQPGTGSECEERANLGGAGITPDGTIIVITRAGCIRVIDSQDMAVTSTFQETIPQGWRLAFGLVALSPSGDHLYFGVGPGIALGDLVREVWAIDTETGERINEYPVEHTVTDIAFDPNGEVLYASSATFGYVMALDAETGEELWRVDDINEPWLVRTAPQP